MTVFYVYSCSNCDYCDWQCELLEFSFKEAKIDGKLIGLISEQPGHRDRVFRESKVAKIIRCKDYSKQPNGKEYFPANKPGQLIEWLNSPDSPRDEDVLVFLDPDMIFRYRVDFASYVKEGQGYGHQLRWGAELDQYKISSAAPENIANATVMYPFALIAKDARRMSSRYRDATEQVYAKWPSQESDMYGLIIALAELGIEMKTTNLAITHSDKEGEEPTALFHYCQKAPGKDIEHVFFKQDYTSSTLDRPWTRPNDPSLAKDKNGSFLLEIIHRLIDGQSSKEGYGGVSGSSYVINVPRRLFIVLVVALISIFMFSSL